MRKAGMKPAILLCTQAIFALWAGSTITGLSTLGGSLKDLTSLIRHERTRGKRRMSLYIL